MDKTYIFTEDEKCYGREPKIYADRFVLHSSDDGKFLLTQHGEELHRFNSKGELWKYKLKKGFIRFTDKPDEEYHPFNYGVYMYETKGMYKVSEEQAKVLLEETVPSNIRTTMREILHSKNLMDIPLDKKAKKLRDNFLEEDYNIVFALVKQQKKAEAEAAKNLEQQKKDAQARKEQSEQKENTSEFLKLFAHFKSKGR